MCDMHCGGGFIRCGAAPGVELINKLLIMIHFIYKTAFFYL